MPDSVRPGSPDPVASARLRPAPSAGRRLAVALALAGFPLAGCHSGTPAPVPSAGPTGAAAAGAAVQPVVSLKELMDSTVDPAADGVWDAVGTVVNAQGTNRHQPRSEEEWHAVRQHAVTLVESMNLVLLAGRHAAPAGAKAGLGELTPEQIDAAIAQNRPEFEQYATATREVALNLLQAVDHKDTAKVIELGGILDERCESCHLRFWYPNSARPAQ